MSENEMNTNKDVNISMLKEKTYYSILEILNKDDLLANK